MGEQEKKPRVALKICGLTRPEDVRAVLEHGADYAGFVVYPKSKRYVTPERAAELWAQGSAGLQHATEPVLVAVNPTESDLTTLPETFPQLRHIQLHGDEAASLRQALPAHWSVWKAVAVGASLPDAAIQQWSELANLLLFDRQAPGEQYGGTGESFDWDLLEQYQSPPPFGIAGGLRPGLLAPLQSLPLSLVDVSSGVESAPGIKDLELIAQFVREFREVWPV